ncbi:hypothetical protein RJ55_05541 [Drechmeria coniospora]|nr:hypothetical protein RJ55_05541 [Drechmeria coniospora]
MLLALGMVHQGNGEPLPVQRQDQPPGNFLAMFTLELIQKARLARGMRRLLGGLIPKVPSTHSTCYRGSINFHQSSPFSQSLQVHGSWLLRPVLDTVHETGSGQMQTQIRSTVCCAVLALPPSKADAAPPNLWEARMRRADGFKGGGYKHPIGRHNGPTDNVSAFFPTSNPTIASENQVPVPQILEPHSAGFVSTASVHHPNGSSSVPPRQSPRTTTWAGRTLLDDKSMQYEGGCDVDEDDLSVAQQSRPSHVASACLSSAYLSNGAAEEHAQTSITE